MHELLNDGEIFVAILRNNGRLQVRYLEKQPSSSSYWYLPLEPTGNQEMPVGVRFFKLNDVEQIKHVVWRVI